MRTNKDVAPPVGDCTGATQAARRHWTLPGLRCCRVLFRTRSPAELQSTPSTLCTGAARCRRVLRAVLQTCAETETPSPTEAPGAGSAAATAARRRAPTEVGDGHRLVRESPSDDPDVVQELLELGGSFLGRVAGVRVRYSVHVYRTGRRGDRLRHRGRCRVVTLADWRGWTQHPSSTLHESAQDVMVE